MPDVHTFSRRSVIAAASAAGLLPLQAQQGESAQGSVPLPPFKSDTDRQSGPPPAPMPPNQRVGICVTGLGNLAVQEILPAIQRTEKVRVAALMSGTPDKARKLAAQYGVPETSVYGYNDYAKLAANQDVKGVYIILPNGMHRDHTVRSFEAGKHVLCEKPMANSVKECEDMIAAGRKAGRHLMIAYRIQYEPNNRHIRELIRNAKYGPVKLMEMVNVQRQGAPDQWRHKKALAGGGSLPDIGLYCLNTSRFLLGEEPVEVFANIYSTPGDPRFREVEENVVAQMRFPGGTLVSFTTGYDSHESRRYRVYCPAGWFGMDPAFSYSGLRMEEAHAEGRLEVRSQPSLEEKNQFGLEMDHFASCVLDNRQPFTPGEEGLQDQRLMEAIYESAKTRKPVSFDRVDKRDAFRGPEPKMSS